jgi:hypothetical protein
MTSNTASINLFSPLLMRMLTLTFVIVASLATAFAIAQECTPLNISPYSGPLFDAMAQTDQGLDGTAAITTAKSVGVMRMALFARVHHHKKKDQDGRALVNRMAAMQPEFITLGAPKLFDVNDGVLSDAYVREVLDGIATKHYVFVGEILFTHGDKEGGESNLIGERYIDPTQPEMERLVQGLNGLKVPVMTHWEVYDWDRDLPRFNKLYASHSKQIFIWPHLGFGTPDQVETVLSAHPNVWATLSKKERSREGLVNTDQAEQIGGSVTDQCGNLLPEWRKVMVEFSDRLMFATDAHKSHRWENYAQIVERWRMILAQLPPKVASAIAYDNAARLYGQSGAH